MHRLMFILAFASMVAQAGRAHADVDIRVGGGSNCSTANIQTAINGAAASNGITNIKIARNVAYNAQQLDINGRNVRLIGGYADCNQATPDATRTILNGAGGSANTVVTVRGASSVVAFDNLEVTGGDEVTGSAGRGGGFTVAGGPHALVYFNNVLVHDNQAGYGGGLYIDNEHSSLAGDVFVHLNDNVSINGNYGAYGGGGIWCRNARVYITGSNSFVINNSTSSAPTVLGPGGGIRADNCEMNIASSGILGSVSLNTAGGAGGGISVTGERANLKLYTLSPQRPVRIAGNTASGVGGGIDIGSSARVTAWDAIIDLNVSHSGGGAVSVFDNDASPRASLLMTGTLEDAPSSSTAAGGGTAVACAASQRCNRIDSNNAMQADGALRTGAALRISADGSSVVAEAVLRGTQLIGNDGENLVEMAGPGARADFIGTALLDNVASAELLHAPFDLNHFVVAWSTIAGNTIGGSSTFRSSMDGGAGAFFGTHLTNSIHWQPGKRIYSVVSGTVNANNTDYVLSNDLSGVPSSTHNLSTDPHFVDAPGHDYRLRLDSPAVDYAIADASGATADHLPRLVNLASVPDDDFGPQDLGAFERQFDCSEDGIFCNGFDG